MRGLTRRDVAGLIGVSPSTVVGWRTGWRKPAPWVRRAVVAIEQARRRWRGPAWFVGYTADPIDVTRKFVIHMNRPGFVHDGQRVVAWLDSPAGIGKKKLRLLIAKASVMATADYW